MLDAVDKHLRPMSSIHAPYVPGWDLQLQKHMNRLFTHMAPDDPVYRHNFNFTYKDAHTAALLHENPWSPVALPHLIEQAEAEGLERASTKAAAKKTGKEIRKCRLEEEGGSFVEEELELLCEYQTLRHMRTASNFILFTVRTYINPFANLLQAPAAAQAMAAAIRRKHRGRLHNRGVGTEAQLRGLLEFLDTTTAAAGLETGLGDGVLPAEPVRVRPIDVQLSIVVDLHPSLLLFVFGCCNVQWERLTVEDGTGPGRDFRGALTWHEKDAEERALRVVDTADTTVATDVGVEAAKL
eukprot:COSAG06_NODE_292_length_18211_cov_36.536937_5_plen_297_part_00